MSKKVKLKCCWPYLIVSNLEENIEFFRDKLGFNIGGREPDIQFAMVGRDGVIILLRGSQHDPSVLVNAQFERDAWPPGYEPYDLSIQVSDVDAYYRELVDRGASPRPPENRPYGRDFGVTLPDGYDLVFLQLES